MIRHSHGRYSSEQIQRCSQMSGTFKEKMRDLLRSGMGLNEVSRSSGHRTPKYFKDIAVMANKYRDARLFTYVPGRRHTGLQGVQNENSLKNPSKLGQNLRNMSSNLDLWRQLLRTEKRSSY